MGVILRKRLKKDSIAEKQTKETFVGQNKTLRHIFVLFQCHQSSVYLSVHLLLWSLYEIIHICTAVVDESEEWSSQLIFQFKQLERRSLKKSGLQRDSNPWPPRYSVGRASHRYRGGHGFESRWSPDFFRLLLSNCLNWKINCDDHSSLSFTIIMQKAWLEMFFRFTPHQTHRIPTFLFQTTIE